jgi:hypothetical protein
MKVGFDNTFKIQGCEIINYLLEKSRVVNQSTNERNYHIFYQIIAGSAQDLSMKQRYKLRTASEYNYLNQSGCMQIKGVDDAMEFNDVLEAMKTLQFSQSTVEEILKILSGILLLGNLEFEGVNGDVETAKMTSKTEELMKECAEILGLDIPTFNYSLTNKRVQMGRGSMVSMKLSVAQAIDSRDTLAKSLYSNLFDWTIQRVNATLKTEHSPFSIGILDIFGFEVFELNSFEQLCINYANEKLQFHFNDVIFSEETVMYAEEGISLDKVNFEDNGECVNLIEGKPYGLLSLLEEECSLGNATDLTYISKCEKTFGTGKPQANKYFIKNKTKPDMFSVVHFAGAVEYNVINFLDKNRDNMSATSKEVMLCSTVSLVAELFQEKVAEGGGGAGGSTRKGSTANTKSTLGGQFRNQLIGLINTLKTTEPLFIRCVKPNHEKVGGKFDGHLALRQLRYAGLFEAIRIRKSGFAYRAPFSVFANTYQLIVEGLSQHRKAKTISDQEACIKILEHMTIKVKKLNREDWQVGQRTKVFLKTNQDRVLLERERNFRLLGFTMKIQFYIKRWLERIRRKREAMMATKELAVKMEEVNKQSVAAVIVQKYWRRKSVLMLMKSMGKFIELRRVLLRKETHRVREILNKIEADLPPDVRSATQTVTAVNNNVMNVVGGGIGVGVNMSRKEKMRLKKLEEAKLSQQHLIWSIFAHEIKVARVMMKVMEVQDTLIEQLRRAMDDNNVKELNRLLLKADKLEMSSHPLVVESRERIMKLYRKQQILKMLINFLKSEDEFPEEMMSTQHNGIPTILAYIQEGKSLGIDSEFLYKVQQIYENAGPRVKTRNRLRTMIELCNRYGIEQSCLEVLQIRKQHSKFAESELRAARMILKLLDMDEQLFPVTGQSHPDEVSQNFAHQDDDESSYDGPDENGLFDIKDLKENGEGAMLWGRRVLIEPTGSKLTPEIINICDLITETTIPAVARKHKQRLQKVIGGSIYKVYACIRYYKWSKSLCIWKYPEILQQKAEKQPEPIFVRANGPSSPGGIESHGFMGMGNGSPSKGLSAIFGGSGGDRDMSVSAIETSASLSRQARLHSSHQSSNKPFDDYFDDEDDTVDDNSTNSAYDEDTGSEEFFGMRFRETRSNPYIIRSLHQDFDMFAQKSTNGEMEAAIGNISLSQSVQQTLKDVEAVHDIDLKIPLPNGSVFDKTAKRQHVQVQSPAPSPRGPLGSSSPMYKSGSKVGAGAAASASLGPGGLTIGSNGKSMLFTGNLTVGGKSSASANWKVRLFVRFYSIGNINNIYCVLGETEGNDATSSSKACRGITR